MMDSSAYAKCCHTLCRPLLRIIIPAIPLPIPVPIPLPFFIMSLAVCALINISINIIVGTMSPAMINERDFVAGFLSFPSVPPYFSYPFSRPIFPHHFPQRPLLSGQIRLLAGIA